MWFTVTYRSKHGNQATKDFESQNREDLFLLLASKGIHAIRIKKRDKNKSSLFPECLCRNRKLITGIIIIGIIVLICFSIRDYYWENDENLNEENSTFSNKVHIDKSATPLNKNEEDLIVQPTKIEIYGEGIKPKVIETKERQEDPLYDRHHIVAKKPLVKEPIEQLMLTVFETELGDMPPMLPSIPVFEEEKFEKVVTLMSSEEEGDTDENKQRKSLINSVKAELSKYLEEGGTTSGFLAYYVNELDKAFQERERCKMIQMRSMKEDDPEVARGVYLRFNKRLIDKGIKPLSLTNRQKEYLRIED